MDMKILGRIRKLLEGIDTEATGSSDNQFTMTPQLELLVAQGAAPYREVTKMGRAIYVNTIAAIGAIVAIPTTAHMLSIYNGYADGGRSFIVDWVAAINVVSTAAAGQAGILANIGQVREAIPVDAALSIKKLNGNGGGQNDTGIRTILNATALPGTTGLAANWFPLGVSIGKPGAAATPGYQLWSSVDGRVIVPPGRFFSIHVLADVVGETFMAYIAGHEAQLQLG